MTASSGAPWTLEDSLGEILSSGTGSVLGARGAGALEGLPAALNALTGKQRFVIDRLWGLSGDVFTLREIAAAMGLSHVAVLRLRNRGLARLRRELGGYQESGRALPTVSFPREGV